MKIERPESKQPIPPHSKKVFEGIIFDVYQWKQELYDGSKTTFEKIKRDDTVVMFPVLPDGKILLVEDEQPGRKKVLVAPAGRIDEGEDPETAAKRELREETGYDCDLVLWKAFQPSLKIDWAIYFFIAKNCRKVSDADPGAGEKVVPHPVTFEELLALADDVKAFHDHEFRVELLQARLHAKKMEELRNLFFGK